MADWSRQHEQKRQKIIELLSRVTPFEDTSEPARKARQRLPLPEWLATYLPHYFDLDFKRFHLTMLGAAGRPDVPLFVCAFRGAGKSVLLALGRPLWRTLRQEIPFWIYGSQARKLAAQNMDYLRIELETNPRIRCDYDLTTDGDQDGWVVDFGDARAPDGTMRYPACLFEAHGIHSSPRGHRFRQHRPHGFVGDDLETLELSRNPDREDNLWRWLWNTVEPALEPEVYEWTTLCNMFGPNCLFERAKQEAQKTDSAGKALMAVYEQAVLDDTGHTVWPEKYSDVALERKRLRGELSSWLREYMLVADDPNADFQMGWIDQNRYDEDELPDGLYTVSFLDPAISERSTACPRAQVVIGCDRNTGVRYVLDAWIKRGSAREMVERLFDDHKRWRPRQMGIEQNGGFALLKDLVEAEQRKRRYRLPVRYVNQTGNKEVRIESLCGEFETGRWRFPRHPSVGVRQLETQFVSYPDGFVDGPDACASAGEMLPDAYRPRDPDADTYKSLRKRRDLAGVL